MISIASADASGAMMTSVKTFTISVATSASIGRLRATMPPKADTVSHRNARRYASASEPATATPHGLACLMMATAAVSAGSNSATSS